jgi:2-polyprenyl-3-methyl-5-hydroxy-6-metoxy-1,4-benzoquinol methylase
MSLLTPARRRGMEILDAPDVDPALVERSLRDVALANRLFGGARAVLAELAPLFATLAARGGEATLLDVGTGLGDIPAAARAAAARRGLALRTIGLDAAEELARASRGRTDVSLCASALALPLRSRSVDVVTCSQVLHHFGDAEARQLIAEMHRVARVAVVISDLRRGWAPAAGIWLASFPLGFHPVSRHDGVVSVLRGFTGAELRAHVRAATGQSPRIAHRPIARVTASWTAPSESHAGSV